MVLLIATRLLTTVKFRDQQRRACQSKITRFVVSTRISIFVTMALSSIFLLDDLKRHLLQSLQNYNYKQRLLFLSVLQ